MNVLFVPGLLGALIFALCLRHLGSTISLLALGLGAMAGGAAVFLLEAKLNLVAWLLLAIVVAGLARLGMHAATRAASA